MTNCINRKAQIGVHVRALQFTLCQRRRQRVLFNPVSIIVRLRLICSTNVL